jgi:hypothetical protein
MKSRLGNIRARATVGAAAADAPAWPVTPAVGRD